MICATNEERVVRAPLLASREKTEEQWACAYCGALFTPTYRQVNNKRWQKKTVFVCSLTCRGKMNFDVRVNTGELQRLGKKASARRQLRAAVNCGELVRPTICENCGKEETRLGVSGIHAHHYKGYDFPLDVQWVCAACHAILEINTRFKRGAEHKIAKLTAVNVTSIRDALRKGDTLAAIAAVFAVSKKTILNIKHGRIWKHVP